jgi:hypothetical protein
MSLLTVIQDHCRIHALNVPNLVIGGADTTVQQLLGIAQQVVDDITDESKFQGITREGNFTMIASESQGKLTTLADTEGFMYAYTGTFFDRTLRRPLYGPLTEIEWQQVKAIPNPGPFYKFRLRGDEILINPVPSAPFSQIYFEYASSWAILDDDGVTYKPRFAADSDTFALPEKILLRGIMYRWKQIKGLPYQADEEKFYSMLNNHIARNKIPRDYNISQTSLPDISPGIFVPSGNWNV